MSREGWERKGTIRGGAEGGERIEKEAGEFNLGYLSRGPRVPYSYASQGAQQQTRAVSCVQLT